MLTVTKVVSRDRQLRSGRVLRVGVASLGQLTRAMDKELKDSDLTERSTCAGGPLDVELQRVFEDAQRVAQRRDMAMPGLWELDPHACCTVCWSQVE